MIRFERKKGLPKFRVRFSKPTAVNFVQKRPTNVFDFYFEHPEYPEYWRTISCPVGWGRFKRGTEAAALELAERRLNEQFGDMAFYEEEQEKRSNPGYISHAAQVVRERPELHQNNFVLVRMTRR